MDTLIAIVGPTGSGKSALGAYLATKLGGEIVSADSRQVYRGMRVISRAEPGHMVGIANPKRQYSAGEYAKAARTVCTRILENKRIPIVIGGTGLFIDALTGRMPLPDVPRNPKLRKELAKRSPAQLAAQLKRLDPARAAQIDLRNPVRLVRAIEVAKGLRKSNSSGHHEFSAENSLSLAPSRIDRGLTALQSSFTSPFPCKILWLGLKQPKNLRAGVEARLRAGMVAEAKKLRAALGKRRYAELGFEFNLLADYIDKKITKAQLVDAMANGERKYAIRQMRWFKRNTDIHWVAGKAEALRLAKEFLRG